jgi:predicted nuclease of predicted toxin-antitoxin system
MEFLLDAQLSRQLVTHLVSSGHRATHVFDHLDPQADDRAIAEVANRLGASVVSKDADFADLASRALLLRTFVWLRVPNLANELLC